VEDNARIVAETLAAGANVSTVAPVQASAATSPSAWSTKMPWCASRRQEWHSTYPTNAHERRGKEVGLPTDKVEPILCGLPTAFSAREKVVYEIAMALTNSRWVAKGLDDRAVAALGHVGITDVITLMGYYTASR
jgi:hypothetical protein